MIKVDLHMHSGEDPKDGLVYPATALIEKAATLGFGAIAITLHGRVLEEPRVFDFARSKGVLLIPAVEWRITHCDVLLYNVTQRDVEKLHDFDDLRAFRRERGEELLVIAPHPYYPIGSSLRHHLERHIDLFDAIEYAHLHIPGIDPNKQGVRIGQKYGKPIVANSDAHNLWMFGMHYTLVDAEPTALSIFRAIREGRLQWLSPHISMWKCLRFILLDPIFRNPRGTVTHSFNGQSPH
jgi:predicted metal-dependent phosphoesterase TrpH